MKLFKRAASLTYLPINVGRDSDNLYELTDKENKPIFHKTWGQGRRKESSKPELSPQFFVIFLPRSRSSPESTFPTPPIVLLILVIS